jgi:inositol-1,3,4-trisphosphate 5/6-kinase/inositol-tetrakisphosphate 1-kinase
MVQQERSSEVDRASHYNCHESTEAGVKLVVGYWLPDKSTTLTDFPTFTNLCREHRIILKKLSLSSDLESQLPFHLLLHKISALYKNSRRQQEEAMHQFSHLYQFIKTHPDLHVIDSVEPQLQLFDRSHVCQLIEDSLHGISGVSIPAWAAAATPEDAQQAMQQHSALSFPLICKPRNTWETFSHEMCIIFNVSHFAHVRLPTIMQNFVRHGSVLFKVYVIGDDVTVQKRPSVDIAEETSSNDDVLTFNGHKISKSVSQSKIELCSDHVTIDMGVVNRVTASLRHHTHLNIFGVDFLVDGSNKHYVVDVNPFPGCSSLETFHHSMLKLLLPYVPAATEETVSDKETH